MDLIAKYFDELSATEIYEILKSRAEIFLLEQNIICQDMDNADYKSLHCFFLEGSRVFAYLRAFPINRHTVKIGRVLTLHHGNGTGKKLLEKSLIEIKNKMNPEKVIVNAQEHAIGFYKKSGFKIISDVFLEEGVPHVAMELDI